MVWAAVFFFPGPPGQALDPHVAGAGHLFVTDLENRIVVHDKDLAVLTAFPGPFDGDDDELSAIAFHPGAGTFFVYNAETNMVAEITGAGELVSGPFPSGVPSDPDDEAAVVSMLFNPAGSGGEGSFWYLDLTRGAIEERDRAGGLLTACIHPDHAAEPPPVGGAFKTFAWGMTPVPGRGFEALDVSGGRVRERGTRRILRLDARTCAPTGEEMGIDGIRLHQIGEQIGLHRTTHDGRDVLYVLDVASHASRILEVDARPPPAPPFTWLGCAAGGLDGRVRLSFSSPPGLDLVIIERDGEPIASLPAGASSHEDPDAPPGLRTYTVHGTRGAARGGAASCTLRVGPGSIAAREFSSTVQFLRQVSLDPLDGSYIAASNSNRHSDSLHRFDRDFRYLGTLPSPFQLPMQVAALAVRSAGGASELYCLGWNPGAGRGTQDVFPVRVVDPSGRILRELRFAMPRPRQPFVTFPAGMVWDRATDTFWCLERNSCTVLNVSTEGRLLASFEHPARIHQDGVQGFGLAIDAGRNALYLSSAGRLDHRITRIVELTRTGILTGVEVPVGHFEQEKVLGFALDAAGTSFAVSVMTDSVSDLVLHRAFDPLEPVSGLACAIEGTETMLSWANGAAYDSISIHAGAALRASLPGGASSWRGEAPPPGVGFYRVVAHREDLSSAGALCEPAAARAFLRGDVEENGDVNITDVIGILSYLFAGGVAPACVDAADVDDQGDVVITDAIALLAYLFTSGPPPAPPFPGPGIDPTADLLDCPGVRAGRNF